GIRRVADGERLRAGCIQDGGEVGRAVVVRRERVVGGERGVAVRAGEVDRPGVVIGQVAVGVVSGDGEGAGVPHENRRREAADQSATARSGRPSPLKSPAATVSGSEPAAEYWAARKVPSPLPGSTLTLLSPRFAVTRSGLPSPVKSATATE